MIEHASWWRGNGRPTVGNEIANLYVSRVVTLVGTSIAIFTFLLFFLYPRFASGEIDPVLFQVTLIVIGVAIFSLVYAGLYFYTLTAPLFSEPCRERGDPTKRRPVLARRIFGAVVGANSNLAHRPIAGCGSGLAGPLAFVHLPDAS